MIALYRTSVNAACAMCVLWLDHAGSKREKRGVVTACLDLPLLLELIVTVSLLSPAHAGPKRQPQRERCGAHQSEGYKGPVA